MLEWIEVFTTIALGLILRFGIPVGLTGLILWSLKQLDQNWQLEAEKVRLTQLAASLDQRPKCWEVRHCSPEMQAQCPAYQRPDLACWQVQRQITGRLPERCLACQVFRNAPVVQPHIAH
jgi:hypothetical protein